MPLKHPTTHDAVRRPVEIVEALHVASNDLPSESEAAQESYSSIRGEIDSRGQSHSLGSEARSDRFRGREDGT
jgi:hypothetical protein